MKILKNTLSVDLDIWEDPGDYPNNAGRSPLPSSYCLQDITGNLIIRIEPEDRESEDWDALGAAINLYTLMEGHRIIIQGVKILTWQLCPEVHPDANLATNLDCWTIVPYEWDDSNLEIN